MSEVDIVRVVEVFEANQARWALVGAHATGLVTAPRATADFDFIVEGAKLAVIVRDLTKVFGDLDEREIGAGVELKAIDVDLIRSTNHPLFQRAIDDLHTIGEWRVPATEVLIALKFLAAVSPWRDRNKRRLDIVDLAAMYEAARVELDRNKLNELASLVYPGADVEFRKLLEQIDSGQPISI